METDVCRRTVVWARVTVTTILLLVQPGGSTTPSAFVATGEKIPCHFGYHLFSLHALLLCPHTYAKIYLCMPHIFFVRISTGFNQQVIKVHRRNRHEIFRVLFLPFRMWRHFSMNASWLTKTAPVKTMRCDGLHHLCSLAPISKAPKTACPLPLAP